MAEAALVFGVGASAGLGATLCRRFAAEGFHVFASGRSEANLEQVAAEISGRLGDDSMLSLDAIADASWALHVQDRPAWTLELDLRPYKEPF
jgi:NADP-dependent 3-hydroxy acid dehydrogenase YdfG